MIIDGCHDKAPHRLKSVDFTLSLLDYFTLEHPRWGVRALATQLERHPSVVQRSLSTLEQHGLLRKDENSKYQLGFKCVLLGEIANGSQHYTQTLKQLIEPLSQRINENVFFYKKENNELVCHYIQESQRDFSFVVKLGHKVSLINAPFGRLLLAYRSTEEIAEQLALLDPAEQAKIHTELAALKESGYSYSFEEIYRGTQAIAVPVLDRNNVPFGVLVVATPSFIDPNELKSWHPQLEQVAMTMSSLNL